jgi:hypothetical protein
LQEQEPVVVSHVPPAQEHTPSSPHEALHVYTAPQLSVRVPAHTSLHGFPVDVHPHPFGPAPPPPHVFGAAHVFGQDTL